MLVKGSLPLGNTSASQSPEEPIFSVIQITQALPRQESHRPVGDSCVR